MMAARSTPSIVGTGTYRSRHAMTKFSLHSGRIKDRNGRIGERSAAADETEIGLRQRDDDSCI